MWKVQLLFIFNQKTALNVVLKQHGENCKSLLQKPFDFSLSLSLTLTLSVSLSLRGSRTLIWTTSRFQLTLSNISNI